MQYDYSLDKNKSQYHKKVIKFLRKEFPLFNIAEEFPINIDNTVLFCDILIKSPIKTIIEISPRHHFEFSTFFHKTIEAFKASQHRDEIKKTWAEINDYLLIVLKEGDFKKDLLFQKKIKEILG